MADSENTQGTDSARIGAADLAAVHLSPRQNQVLRLIADGMTEIEIAAELAISPRTVRMHADALRMKLGVSRRRHLAHIYHAVYAVGETRH